ncbi:DEBR0S4_08108g1_1 [Brettanomyces bruxellensis]|uniref:Inheritance of peroxisomes protein 1 n=1 Tax=Dekkera bruxellensis TaxID=5007 RepID=A0A3F2Y6S5_DEKBR|nr:DEBR0S4_08108g1_1 [Brettanomyces bruxellensis]
MARQIHKETRVVSEPVSFPNIPKLHSVSRNTNTRRCVSSDEFISQFSRGSISDENSCNEMWHSTTSSKRRSRIRRFFTKLSANGEEKSSRTKEKERVVLFSCKKARITAYNIDGCNSHIKSTQGSLLAQGEFQIYELGANRTTYFICGQVVHPVMKCLKIFRAGPKTFVLPLYNPERYWKIDLETANSNELAILECVLRCVCEYKDLSVSGFDDTSDDLKDYDSSLDSDNATVVLNKLDLDSDKSLGNSEVQNSAESDLVASEGDYLSTMNENESITRDTSASIIVSSSPINPKKHVVFQPIPLRPSSGASMDSVLSKFERIDICTPNSHTYHNDQVFHDLRKVSHDDLRTVDLPEACSWMDPQNCKSEGRNINKRYSLTFKSIRPKSVSITLPLTIGELEKSKGSSNCRKLVGADIVKNSLIVGKLKEESQRNEQDHKGKINSWSRFFGW